MKAVLIDKNDKSLHLCEVPDPTLKADEVLIKISAAALNRADLLQREGNYPPPPGSPEWMGLEVSGTIVAMGNEAMAESEWHIGDKVCALLGGGGYAEYVSVKYDMLMPIPEGCSMIEAAALPEALATAYLNLFIEGNIQKGDTLLIHAGGSGLASVTIPLAKAYGIRVITTVRSDEKADMIRDLGADVIVNTKKTDITEVLRIEAENGHPVNVSIDCVGGVGMGKCLPFVAHGARWIIIAALAGNITELDLKSVYVKNIRIIGSTLRSRHPKMKAKILASLVKEVWPLVSEGKIKPKIWKTYPIERVEDAQAAMYANENVGKIVLTVEK
jgi:NADPH2:quinone reductase